MSNAIELPDVNSDVCYDDPTEKLIADIARITLHIPITHGAGARIRIAVTPAEWQAIREFCLKRDGLFCGRIKDFELMVEDMPNQRWFETAKP